MYLFYKQLYLDGVLQKLPNLEGIVLLNINSWSAGCSVWSDSSTLDELGPSRMDDRMLEVVGLYSSLHVGKIQVSLADPIRLGQAREVKVSQSVYEEYLYLSVCMWERA